MKTNLFSKTIIALLLSVAIVSVYSCSSDDDDSIVEEPSLSIELPDGSAAPSSLEMSAEEGTQNLAIVSNGTWKITKKGDDTDWISVTPEQGAKNGDIKIAVAENTKTSKREASLVFAVDDKENFKSITIVQKAYGPALSVTPKEIEVISSSGDDITFEIDANNDKWEYVIADNPDWVVEKEKTATTLVLTVDKNSKDERTASITFKLSDYESVTQDVTITQNGVTLSVSPEKVEELSDKGEDVTFTIDTDGNEWEYVITNSPNWISQKEKTETSLTLTADMNTGAERSAAVTFKLVDHPSVTVVVDITQTKKTELIADMLDVVFNLDGTATDVSPMKNIVELVSDPQTPLSVAHNASFNKNVVTFKPLENGSNAKEGEGTFYKVNYQDNVEFQEKLADGHTFEAYVKFDVDYTITRNYETKFFSTQQAGGTGFLITNSNQATGGNALTFLPNVPAASGGASNWIWTNSQVRPDGESWYHVVGVWNKDEGKSYMYVNGEKKSEQDAVGFYRPANLDTLWVGIGCDPGNKGVAQNLYEGSMAIARIYDKALTEAEVEYLWSELKQ